MVAARAPAVLKSHRASHSKLQSGFQSCNRNRTVSQGWPSSGLEKIDFSLEDLHVALKSRLLLSLEISARRLRSQLDFFNRSAHSAGPGTGQWTMGSER